MKPRRIFRYMLKIIVNWLSRNRVPQWRCFEGKYMIVIIRIEDDSITLG